MRLQKQNSVFLPSTGFVVENLSKEDQKEFGVKEGVKIMEVPEGYNRYDLRGKVITEVDGKKVGNIDDKISVQYYSNTSH